MKEKIFAIGTIKPSCLLWRTLQITVCRKGKKSLLKIHLKLAKHYHGLFYYLVNVAVVACWFYTDRTVIHLQFHRGGRVICWSSKFIWPKLTARLERMLLLKKWTTFSAAEWRCNSATSDPARPKPQENFRARKIGHWLDVGENKQR